MGEYLDVKRISETAYQFLLNFRPEEYEDGRYDLSDGVYVNIMTYQNKYRKEAFYEAHKRYIDIQLILKGREIIAVEPIEIMHEQPCLTPYDEEKDVEFYANNPEGVDHVLGGGEYRIYLPEDGHMPGICVEKPEEVRKAVIKIPVR